MAGEDGYWQTAADDEAMQDEHAFLWRAMVDTTGLDLSGLRVLDVGCNRGGFLRMLVDRCGIAEGYGYDPASGAVDDARRLAGDRPLVLEHADTVPSAWRDLDVAFSHEVLYLLPDLRVHARAVRGALRPGASYFAAMGVHAGSPLMAAWHAEARDELQLPPLYDLDEVVAAFDDEGFDVAVARLQVGFVPLSSGRGGHGHRQDLAAWLDYYTEDKVLLRCTRPA